MFASVSINLNQQFCFDFLAFLQICIGLINYSAITQEYDKTHVTLPPTPIISWKLRVMVIFMLLLNHTFDNAASNTLSPVVCIETEKNTQSHMKPACNHGNMY